MVPLITVIAINVLMFLGIFSRIIPSQALLSAIPEVSKRGASKITQYEGNVTQFPAPMYAPPAGDPGRKS